MGWGKTLLLGTWGNRMDMDQMETDLAAVREALAAKAQLDRNQDQAIADLQADVNELKLYLITLIRLLTHKAVVSRPEIERLVRMVDSQDGLADVSDVEIDLRDPS
jgi:hypothetical protein